MKLYHGTSAEAAESILANGLIADNESRMARLVEDAVIYGFDNADDAENFAIDQCYDGGFVVFEFETDEVELDPEYDGNAFICTEAKNLKLVIDWRD